MQMEIFETYFKENDFGVRCSFPILFVDGFSCVQITYPYLPAYTSI